ncbi:hypothetical protein WJX77_009996 [Trebouxia sp. C0004]
MQCAPSILRSYSQKRTHSHDPVTTSSTGTELPVAFHLHQGTTVAVDDVTLQETMWATITLGTSTVGPNTKSAIGDPKTESMKTRKMGSSHAR